MMASAFVNSILTITFLTKRSYERRNHPGPVQPQHQQSSGHARFNNSGKNDAIYDAGTLAFIVICLVGFSSLLMFGIDPNHFLETYLFAQYVIVGCTGFMLPVTFYLKNKNLRSWIKRDLLQI